MDSWFISFNRWFLVWLIVSVYLSASLVLGPLGGRLFLTKPMPISGDSPHYLVSVNSLIEDGDFDLANNYQQAQRGDFDLGSRFQGQPIDHHADLDRSGREIGTHSPFFALLLASLTWPFAHTNLVGPVSIWLTLIVSLVGIGLAGIFIRGRLRELGWKERPAVLEDPLLFLAFASPLLCYSRDLWTEPWVMSVWIAMLLTPHLAMSASLGFLGSLIKYPFVVVPVTMGLVALYQRKTRAAMVFLGSGLSGFLVAVGTTQYLFQDVDHFSLFHVGNHSSFDLPFDGILGLLFSPSSGLLVYFPVFFWAIPGLFRRLDINLPLFAFLLLHAFYSDWGGGTGFSARFLVPILPLLVLAVLERRPRGWLFRLAALYSAFWGLVGGFFPPLVYERSPWAVCALVWSHL